MFNKDPEFSSVVKVLLQSICTRTLELFQGGEYYCCRLLYIFGYEVEIFPSNTKPKNLDLSYKTDLDFGNLFKREKHIKVKMLVFLNENYSGVSACLAFLQRLLDRRNNNCFPQRY